MEWISHSNRPSVSAAHRDDGSILLVTELDLPPIEGSIAARLGYWARWTPHAVYMSDGDRLMSYAQAETARRSLSAKLLAMSLGAPIMIVGENGIDHALVMLAATAIGIPVSVIAPAYVAAAAKPWTRFDGVLDRIAPSLIFADDPAFVEYIVGQLGRDVRIRPLRDLSWLQEAPLAKPAEVSDAERLVGPDSIAKLLFTSGSTGTPRAVTITQRMMVSNMIALGLVWDFLSDRPPVLVDWLPWSHTFGGNCCFNIALWFGGHLHVDKGRPAPGLIGRSVEAIRQYRPTLYFNVPIGYEHLLPLLEADLDFARQFLKPLDFLFTAGAPMPQSLQVRLEAVAMAAIGRRPTVASGWGSTETAPFSTVLCFPAAQAANLGIPLPGTTIKMVPEGDRYELRVRGPNVMPCYWGDRAGTEAAFDEEGYYRIGDAGKLADPADPAAGILFDGRVAENFKLSSGTFVNVGALRVAIISATDNLVSDLVIAGEGRSELSALLFLNDEACRLPRPALIERLTGLLAAFNAGEAGSSRRIERFMIADESPSAAHEEITEKGYLNQRRIRQRRAALFETIHAQGVEVTS